MTVQKRRGFILGVVVWALAVLSAIMVGYSIIPKHAKSLYATDTTPIVYNAVIATKSKILTCYMLYPSGDNGTGFNIPFPAATTETDISLLTCPGDPSANQNLWTGNNGVFIPKLPNGFTGPVYKNDASGIYIKISCDGTTERLDVMQKVAAKFDPSEASLVGNDLTVWIKK